MVEFAIAAVPLLLLVVSLACGRYPGCETAMRIAERFASRLRTARAARNRPRPRRPESRAAHGGLLLAFGLSGRAPPAQPSL